MTAACDFTATRMLKGQNPSLPLACLMSALVFAFLAAPAPAAAQWLDYPTPGVPRLEDGSPDLDAPTPRTPEGKPDFSGMWFSNVPSVAFCREEDCISEERMAMEQVNIGRNLEGGLPYSEWSQEVMVERRRDGGRYDPHTYCMPPNYPRAWTLPQYQKIVQTPELIVMLHEFNGAYRQVFVDGRPLEEDPNPTWNGHSTAHWEGDTLVILTNGIRSGDRATDASGFRAPADRAYSGRPEGLHRAMDGHSRASRAGGHRDARRDLHGLRERR